ncbi:MAG: hypothetical protein IFK94_03420 [Acidobacteria bacterium]|uniref:Phosphoenolpyruvate synthase n=1 Tax=Candidatus Polarisedimenticola svalbardensis TaxID=2886004 RepID=A0A8J7CC95_9BACT|nr:hypothetical protein [Candidatus Polarisedimenticola svalbardensis]
MEPTRTSDDGRLTVYTGRGTAPGHACGPLRSNSPELDPDSSLGVILVAGRAVPEDVGRILAAAGTITFGGAVLSHISLLSREFGKPSVSMADSLEMGLIKGPGGVLALTMDQNGGTDVLSEGDIVLLDGSRGKVLVPGAGVPAFREALRELFPRLVRFGAEQDEAGFEERLEPLLKNFGEPLLEFLMEATVLYRVIPAGGPTGRLMSLLERNDRTEAVQRLRRDLALRVQERIRILFRNAEGELAAITEPDDLKRRVDHVQDGAMQCHRQMEDLGVAPAGLEEALMEYRAKVDAIRDGLRFALTRDVKEMLALPDEALRHRIGGLFQLLRRTRNMDLDRELTGPLQACLSKHLAEERARAGAHLIIPLDAEDGIRDRSLVGGKAAGLFQVRSILPAGCRIPWGFVVTTSAYKLHLLGENGERVREAAQSGGDESSISRRAKAAILGTSIPREVADALKAAIAGHESTRLAVRSSGTLEDGPAGSLAGQYDTYLGVQGRKELDRRIRMAWASLWNHRAIRMLTAQGHALTSAVQAVLVQEVIETRCAGVLFSRDPSGKPDTILINAAWGLGEGISQGEVEGDLYWVRRSTGELIGSDTGRVENMIVLDPDRTGTVEGEVPDGRKGLPCLDFAELKRLAELACCLENATGRGQDVEFGFTEQGDLMVFQVRRVMQYRPK